MAALAHPEHVLAHLSGADLTGVTYRHPFIDRESGVYAADHVTAEAGTGLVHTAPGHGQEDYQLGLAVGLDIYNPVDDHGRYVEDLPEEIAFLRGVRVWDANPKIIDLLVEKGALLSPKDLSVTHSYPHCWRCSNPVIFRATYQWFISMEDERPPGEGPRRESTGSTGSPPGARTGSGAWSRTARTGASPGSAPGACPSPSSTARTARSRWPTRT